MNKIRLLLAGNPKKTLVLSSGTSAWCPKIHTDCLRPWGKMPWPKTFETAVIAIYGQAPGCFAVCFCFSAGFSMFFHLDPLGVLGYESLCICVCYLLEGGRPSWSVLRERIPGFCMGWLETGRSYSGVCVISKKLESGLEVVVGLFFSFLHVKFLQRQGYRISKRCRCMTYAGSWKDTFGPNSRPTSSPPNPKIQKQWTKFIPLRWMFWEEFAGWSWWRSLRFCWRCHPRRCWTEKSTTLWKGRFFEGGDVKTKRMRSNCGRKHLLLGQTGILVQKYGGFWRDDWVFFLPSEQP